MDYKDNLDIPEQWNRKTIAPSTTRYAFDIMGNVDLVFQWVLETAAGAPDAATFVFYGSILPKHDLRLKELDPALNKFWKDQTALGAVFPSNPGTATGTDQLPLGNNALGSVMIELIVASTVTFGEICHLISPPTLGVTLLLTPVNSLFSYRSVA